MAVATEQNVGRVVQVIGPVIDIEFEVGQLPAIYNAVQIASDEGSAPKVDHRRGGRAAPRREPRAHRGDGADRRHGARHEGGRPRRADHRAGRPGTLGRVLNVLGGPVDFPGPTGGVGRALADPSPGAEPRGAIHRAQDVRDRHQGRRPARAVSHAAARSASSAALASARRSSSRSSSTTSR